MKFRLDISSLFYGAVQQSSCLYICGGGVATVGALHRSRVVRWAGAVGIRGDGIPPDRVFVGWGPVIFRWYVSVFNPSFSD